MNDLLLLQTREERKDRKALVSAGIPKDHRSEFYRFMRRCKRSDAAPKIYKASVMLFASMLKWDDYSEVSTDHFVIATIVLSYHSDNEKAYSTLTPNAQKFFVTLPRPSLQRRWDGTIYLNMLSRLESLPDCSIMQPRLRTHGGTLSFAEVVNAALEEVEGNAENEGIAARLDLTSPSETLIELMRATPPRAFKHMDHIIYDVLFMCKVIYGEKTVIDFYERFSEYPIPFTGEQIFDILDDWENLQSYPVEWIMQTAVR